MDPDRRGGGEKLGEWKQERRLIGMRCVGENFIFNKRKIKYKKTKMKEREKKSGLCQ